MADVDVHFYFDPVCPFCWMTSKWLRIVADQRGLTVDWRFISLRVLNAHVDYDAQFPPEYEAGHTAGLLDALEPWSDDLRGVAGVLGRLVA